MPFGDGLLRSLCVRMDTSRFILLLLLYRCRGLINFPFESSRSWFLTHKSDLYPLKSLSIIVLIL